jgi:hypothetical protein
MIYSCRSIRHYWACRNRTHLWVTSCSSPFLPPPIYALGLLCWKRNRGNLVSMVSTSL